MKKSSFTSILAAIVLMAGGCATSDWRIPPGAGARFMNALTTDYPVREGIVANTKPYPVWVTIDDQPEKRISQTPCYDYFSITAKQPHHIVVKDANDKIVKEDKDFTVPDEPLGKTHRLPRGKKIDTGWKFTI